VGLIFCQLSPLKFAKLANSILTISACRSVFTVKIPLDQARLFTFVNFQAKLAETKSQMETQLAGNPFRGLADVTMQSIQLQWGWAVLVVGAGLVITAAALQPKTKGLTDSGRIYTPNPSLQSPSGRIVESGKVNETRNIVFIAIGTVLIISLMIIAAYYNAI
jgi:hypothetical protein